MGSEPLRTFGGWTVLAELGRGGFGAVYRVRDPRTGAERALKVILAGFTIEPAELERFRREAEVLARVDHPGIVRVHSSGVENGVPFTVMELVEGRSLEEVIGKGPLGADRSAEIIAEAARALHHAHRLGVIHRDLKPENLIIEPGGATRVLDFGLALDASGARTRLTMSGEAFGTPAFMAPEQAAPLTGEAAGAIDPRTDVWGLGAILYVLLTGRAPFGTGDPISVLTRVLEERPTAPSEMTTSSVPPPLEAICLRCLEHDPRRRYRSAAALADDLDRFRRGEGVRARREGALGALGRRLLGTRGRRIVTAVGVIAALVLLGTTIAARIAGDSVARVSDTIAQESDARDLFDVAYGKVLDTDQTSHEELRAARGLIGEARELLARADADGARVDGAKRRLILDLETILADGPKSDETLEQFLDDPTRRIRRELLFALLVDARRDDEVAVVIDEQPSLLKRPEHARALAAPIVDAPAGAPFAGREAVGAVFETLRETGDLDDLNLAARVQRRRIQDLLLGDASIDELDAELVLLVDACVWKGAAGLVPLEGEALDRLITRLGRLPGQLLEDGEDRPPLRVVDASLALVPFDDPRVSSVLVEVARTNVPTMLMSAQLDERVREQLFALGRTLYLNNLWPWAPEGSFDFIASEGLGLEDAQAAQNAPPGHHFAVTVVLWQRARYVTIRDPSPKGVHTEPLAAARAFVEVADPFIYLLRREETIGDVPASVLSWIASKLQRTLAWSPVGADDRFLANDLDRMTEALDPVLPEAGAPREARFRRLIDQLHARAVERNRAAGEHRRAVTIPIHLADWLVASRGIETEEDRRAALEPTVEALGIAEGMTRRWDLGEVRRALPNVDIENNLGKVLMVASMIARQLAIAEDGHAAGSDPSFCESLRGLIRQVDLVDVALSAGEPSSRVPAIETLHLLRHGPSNTGRALDLARTAGLDRDPYLRRLLEVIEYLIAQDRTAEARRFLELTPDAPRLQTQAVSRRATFWKAVGETERAAADRRTVDERLGR